MKEVNYVADQKDTFSAGNLLSRYFRHKSLFVFFLFLAGVLSAAFIFLSTPQYGIYASLVIKDERKGEPSDFPFRDIDVFDDRTAVDNESEIIRSKSTVEPVVNQMQLNVNYYYREYQFKKTFVNYESPVVIQTTRETAELYDVPVKIHLDSSSFRVLNVNKVFRYGELAKTPLADFTISKTLFFGTNDHRDIEITIISRAEAIEGLRNNISVTQTSKNASMLNLVLLHPVPAQGIDVLSNIIREYNNSNHRYRQLQTAATVGVIQDRLNMLAGQLNTIERKTQQYKTRMGITDLSADAQTFLDKAKDIDTKISDVQIRMEALESIEVHIKQVQDSSMPATTGLNDPVLLNLLTKISDLGLEYNEQANTLGRDNTTVKTKAAQIATLRRNILGNISVQKTNTRLALNQLLEEKEKIDTEIRQVPVNERNLTSIVREKNIQENLFNYLLQKREEANIASASEYTKLRLVDSPYSSIKPVKPDKWIVAFTGLLFGLVAPIVIINVREALRSKVSAAQLHEIDNPSIIGEVALHKKVALQPVMTKRNSFTSEQFRIVVAKMKSEYPGVKTILVTSSMPGEGKSYVSTHVAEVLASWGNKAILVDADMRKGKLSRDLEIERQEPGLSDFLLDPELDINDIIHTYGDNANSLDVISSGTQISSSFRLSSNGRIGQLFEYLNMKYEYVIVNTPPVRLVSDALTLAKYTDVTLYIVRDGYSSRDTLKFIADINESKALGHMFIVLNGSSNGVQRSRKAYKAYFKEDSK